MSVARCYSFLVLTFALFPPSSASGASRAEVEIDRQIEKFVKTLRTEKLRDLAKHHAGAFKKKDEEATSAAIDFFYDLKAKDVLFALLYYSEPGQWSDWQAKPLGHFISAKITDDCLDVFGIVDVPRLYEASLRFRGTWNGADMSRCNDVIDRLSERTSALLRIEHVELTPRIRMTTADKLAWWLKAVKTAKEKGSCPSDLDAVVKYFEKLEEEERKKPKEK